MLLYVNHPGGPTPAMGDPEHRPASATAESGSIASLGNAASWFQLYACSEIVGRSVCAGLRSCPISCKSCLRQHRDVGTGSGALHRT